MILDPLSLFAFLSAPLIFSATTITAPRSYCILSTLLCHSQTLSSPHSSQQCTKAKAAATVAGAEPNVSVFAHCGSFLSLSSGSSLPELGEVSLSLSSLALSLWLDWNWQWLRRELSDQVLSPTAIEELYLWFILLSFPVPCSC